MESNERDRKLDQWLDEALSEYGAAEPRFGLEQRILKRITADKQASVRRWNLWRWMPAFAAIAAVGIVAVAVRPVMIPKKNLQTEVVRPVASGEQEKDRKQDVTGSGSLPSTEQFKTKAATDTLDSRRVAATSTREKVKDLRPAEESAVIQTVPSPVGRSVVLTQQAAVANTVQPPPPPPPPASLALGDRNSTVASGAPTMKAPIPQTIEASSGDGINLPTRSVSTLSVPNQNLRNWREDKQKELHVSAEQIDAALSSTATDKKTGAKAAFGRSEENTGVDNGVVDFFGMKIRIESVSAASARPRQFPSPVSLSEQEKLAIAAAQKLKGAVKTDGADTNTIKIKEVLIAPLEGPQK